MLHAEGVPFHFHDYVAQPLTAGELRALLAKLGKPARDVLGRKDASFAALGLTGDEDDDTLIPLLAAHPTLLQRPIGVRGDRAVVGRPPELLLVLREE